MTNASHTHPTNPAPSRAAWYQRPSGVAGAMATMILVFYILREHWYHIAGYWSYLLLLVCPLMHVFHRGHHGHGGHLRDPDNSGSDRG